MEFAMRRWPAILLALCVCLPAWSQTPTRSAAVPGTAVPGASSSSSAPPATRAGAAPSSAATPESAPVYRIELVVFRALSALGAPENWNAEASAAGPVSAPHDTDSAAAAAQAPQTRALVRLLPASEFELDGIVARLRSSGRFVPVAHAAWWQSASPWGRPTEIPVQDLGLAAQGLTGTLSLQRGEFLHLELALDYAIDNPPAALGAAPGTVFSLHQMQRVRFNQRSYFDHPAFGVIALVTPAQGPRRAHK
ncbi:MAG TPA: CsiV family protein [Steroidobacteraceae bacterium]|nr:CsiV family protein [Steroidobacteraceae bacterium]